MAQRTPLERFDRRADELREVITRFAKTDDVEPLAGETREQFASLAPDIPYLDQPTHVMAASAFGVYRFLAMWKAARARGYDVHELGRAILATPAVPGPAPTDSGLAALRKDAEVSQRGAAPDEFVFEMIESDRAGTWGMNITSCAVCHAYAKHDAMDLVPYMCATDDVASTASDQGLRRSGTIALGSACCDFRYEIGGPPLPLVDQYPDRIRHEPGS